MIIIILAIVILLIVLWVKMVKHGSKNINNAVNQINDIKADNARMKAADITKKDLKRIKKQNIERRKAGLPYWIGSVSLSKRKCVSKKNVYWIGLLPFCILLAETDSLIKCKKSTSLYLGCTLSD